MALTLITPPDAPPLTLAEVKLHLRVDTTDDDDLITLYLEAAVSHIDGKNGWLQRALKPQTWELTWDTFPADAIQIPLPPLISIESIKYLDADGAEQTIDPGNYAVDTESTPGWVAAIDSFAWPATLSRINAVRVRFVAGYADTLPGSGQSDGEFPSNVPAAIKAAILLMVGDWYEFRESVTPSAANDVAIPAHVKALLNPYRIVVFA